MYPLCVVVLKLSKIVSFLHFFLSNEFRTVIAVYVYAFESSRLTLSENGAGYYAVTYSLKDVSG